MEPATKKREPITGRVAGRRSHFRKCKKREPLFANKGPLAEERAICSTQCREREQFAGKEGEGTICKEWEPLAEE